MGVENQVGELYFDVDARTGKLVPALQQAEGTVQSFGKRAQTDLDRTTASMTRLVTSTSGVGGAFGQLAAKAGPIGLVAAAIGAVTVGVNALADASRKANEEVGKIGENIERRGQRSFLESVVGKSGADIADLEAERTAAMKEIANKREAATKDIFERFSDTIQAGGDNVRAAWNKAWGWTTGDNSQFVSGLEKRVAEINAQFENARKELARQVDDERFNASSKTEEARIRTLDKRQAEEAKGALAIQTMRRELERETDAVIRKSIQDRIEFEKQARKKAIDELIAEESRKRSEMMEKARREYQQLQDEARKVGDALSGSFNLNTVVSSIGAIQREIQTMSSKLG